MSLNADTDGESSRDEPAPNLDDFIERRARRLREYHDQSYEHRFRALIDRVRDADLSIANHELRVTKAAADALYHHMAIKDEYEVARLLTEQGL